MKAKRHYADTIVNVDIDYQTKHVRLDINKENLCADNGASKTISLMLKKQEVTQLIAALKSQRDRKGVK